LIFTVAVTGIEGALMAAIGVLSGVIAHLWRMQVAQHCRVKADLEKRIEVLEKAKTAIEARCHALELENHRLLTQFIILSSSHDSSPLPQWVKDEDGRILAVNRAYERIFLLPRGYKIQDYLHQKDSHVWPKAIAEEFKKNDDLVWRTRRVHDLLEKIEMPGGEVRKMRIIKFPRYADGIENPIGIAGIAVPDKL
jgi:PAS domain S-box-containing protein